MIGDLVQATLDVGDGESRNQSDSYADCYTFSGSAGDQIDISMSSDDFDTVVYLSNEEGEVLADDDDGGDGTNSRIFSFELPSNDPFAIEATSFSGGVVGSYTLALTRFETPACVPISYGQTVEGSLEASDAESRIRTDSRADCYTFSANEGDLIGVSLSSDAFDAYVSLLDASDEVLTSDDDGGLGIDSRIVLFRAPATGTFSIEATSYGSGEAGSYTLILTRTEAPECTAISYGQTLEGSLDLSDTTSVARTDSRADCYTFSSMADEGIIVSIISDDFDTYLSLLDPSGQIIASDDDGGEGSDSRIPEEGTLTIPSTGDYTIEVTSYFSDETGTYSLTLQRVDALSLAVTVPSPEGKAKPDPYARVPKGPPGKFVKKALPSKKTTQ